MESGNMAINNENKAVQLTPLRIGDVTPSAELRTVPHQCSTT
jgi:hypothetical protein